jgi:polyisoprenoid-binding protein YceI
MSSLTTRILSCFAALACLIQPAFADTWVFDKQHTEIHFSWDNLGVSRRSGRFLDMDGTLTFSPTDPEGGAIEVTIRSASISTGTRELDDALKSPDFFAVAANPRITFRSVGIVKRGDKSAELQGELTILGVTRPVTLATTWNFTGEHPLATSNPTYQGKWVAGFTATTKVLRSEFGLKRGIPLLSDEVRIDIDAVFLRRE